MDEYHRMKKQYLSMKDATKANKSKTIFSKEVNVTSSNQHMEDDLDFNTTETGTEYLLEGVEQIPAVKYDQSMIKALQELKTDLNEVKRQLVDEQGLVRELTEELIETQKENNDLQEQARHHRAQMDAFLNETEWKVKSFTQQMEDEKLKIRNKLKTEMVEMQEKLRTELTDLKSSQDDLIRASRCKEKTISNLKERLEIKEAEKQQALDDFELKRKNDLKEVERKILHIVSLKDAKIEAAHSKSLEAEEKAKMYENFFFNIEQIDLPQDSSPS